LRSWPAHVRSLMESFFFCEWFLPSHCKSRLSCIPEPTSRHRTLPRPLDVDRRLHSNTLALPFLSINFLSPPEIDLVGFLTRCAERMPGCFLVGSNPSRVCNCRCSHYPLPYGFFSPLRFRDLNSYYRSTSPLPVPETSYPPPGYSSPPFFSGLSPQLFSPFSPVESFGRVFFLLVFLRESPPLRFLGPPPSDPSGGITYRLSYLKLSNEASFGDGKFRMFPR